MPHFLDYDRKDRWPKEMLTLEHAHGELDWSFGCSSFLDRSETRCRLRECN